MSDQWIRCSDNFYRVLSKRIIRDKKMVKTLNAKTNKKYFTSFYEATDDIAKKMLKGGDDFDF